MDEREEVVDHRLPVKAVQQRGAVGNPNNSKEDIDKGATEAFNAAYSFYSPNGYTSKSYTVGNTETVEEGLGATSDWTKYLNTANQWCSFIGRIGTGHVRPLLENPDSQEFIFQLSRCD